MFQQSSSRNWRSKGSKVKRVLKVVLLLAIVVWLFHEINKKEYTGSYQSNVSKEEDVNLGRKGKAGSENVIITDSQKVSFDGASETNEAGDEAEISTHNAEEQNQESEEPQEVISNTGQTETEQQQLGYTNDNSDSSMNMGDEISGSGTSEDIENVLELPSQGDTSRSSDQGEGNNEVNLVEQDELVTLAGVNNDSGEAITSSENNFLNSIGQLEVNEVEKEATDSQGVQSEGTKENNVEGVTTNVSSDDEDASQSFHNEGNNGVSTDNEVSKSNKPESQGEFSTGAETTEFQTVETVNSAKWSEDSAVSLSSSTEESKVEMASTEEAPKREAVELHNEVEKEATDSLDVQSEGTNENNMEGAVTTNISSDDEGTTQSFQNEGNNGVSTENEVSENNKPESQGDFSTDAETTENQTAETVILDTKSEDNAVSLSSSTEESRVEMAITEEVFKGEAVELHNKDSEEDKALADNPSIEEESKTELNDQHTRTSDGTGAELSTVNELLERDAVESRVDNDSHNENEVTVPYSDVEASNSQEGSITGVENAGNSFKDVTKSAEDATDVSHINEEKSLEVPGDETPDNKAAETQENDASQGENPDNTSSEETKTEPISNQEQSSGNGIALSTGNRKDDGAVSE